MIRLDKIPGQGKIEIVTNGIPRSMEEVIKKTNTSQRLEVNDLNERSWLMNVLNCINQIPSTQFTLEEVYRFDEYLEQIYPQNRNIRPKIRQQLQFLRDKGFLEFLGNGHYKKT